MVNTEELLSAGQSKQSRVMVGSSIMCLLWVETKPSHMLRQRLALFKEHSILKFATFI